MLFGFTLHNIRDICDIGHTYVCIYIYITNFVGTASLVCVMLV